MDRAAAQFSGQPQHAGQHLAWDGDLSHREWRIIEDEIIRTTHAVASTDLRQWRLQTCLKEAKIRIEPTYDRGQIGDQVSSILDWWLTLSGFSTQF
jgi:hypothetical protein